MQSTSTSENNGTLWRSEQLRALLYEPPEAGGLPTEFAWDGLIALVGDAVLERDIDSLVCAQRGLRHVRAPLPEASLSPHDPAAIARVQTLLGLVAWVLGRAAACGDAAR